MTTTTQTHTPGPWQIEAGLTGLFICAPGTFKTAPTRPVIAETCNQSVSPDEETANARLIAAAPDLLDALNGLMLVIETTNPAWKAMRAVSKAAEAIAKATAND